MGDEKQMIQLQNINKTYGSFAALKNINLQIKEKEFVAILGPSGCGKTTLLNLLAGFMKPSGGEIIFHKQLMASDRILLPPEKRDISMVFQSHALWPHMTVEEHIYFPLKHHRFGKIPDKQVQSVRVQAVLKLMGLENLKNRFPSELSGGQRQRVALGRAIAPNPSVLLMDEPLSALDAELRIEMRKEIQRIHQQVGTTIVYVTHDQGEALAMADRIVVMNQGEIEQMDTPENIYTKPKSIFVSSFVGKCNVVSGKWITDDRFVPQDFPSVTWGDIGITTEVKQQNVYLIRPEQFRIGEPQPDEIQGKVLFSQYQGKEIHYTVQVNESKFSVISSVFEKRYEPGQSVSLDIKVKEKEAILI